MDEYIKKNQALCCFSGWVDQHGDFHEPDEMIEYQRIEQLPAADVATVMRGEWIEENTRPRSGVFYCSSCHRTCYDLQPTRLKGWTKRCRYAFCPNCGADMRGR